MAGIYIHIPFCKQACTYCDFHFSVNPASKNELIKALVKEIEFKKNYLKLTTIETIYFGGGTPSILNKSELEMILTHVNRNFKCASNAEMTIECNPDDLTKQKLIELKQLGFNRLSIGLQSFNDEELKWMNRAHSAYESIQSVQLAQEAGFSNITIDLIYGSKFQDKQTWQKTLETTLSLNVQHISAYNLTIETKTKLGLNHFKGNEPAINEDLSAEQFKAMISVLEKNEFMQYEISNFGKKNFFSQHNSNYWLGIEYIGIGPSAHSYNGLSRQWNISSNKGYIDQINKNGVYYQKEILTHKEKYNEYILTRLRTVWGCNRITIEEKFGENALDNFDQTVDKYKDYFVKTGNVISLNLEGKLRADFITSEFFG